MSNYVGLVPRIDISGTIVKIGHIIKGCIPIKRVAIQSAWARVRSNDGDAIKAKFQDIASRRGNKVAIVAASRKMVELIYILIKNRMYYRGMSDEKLIAKLKFYKVYNENDGKAGFAA